MRLFIKRFLSLILSCCSIFLISSCTELIGGSYNYSYNEFNSESVCNIRLPELPIKLNTYSHYTIPRLTYVCEATCVISDITYEYDESLNRIFFYLTGRITYIRKDIGAGFTITLYNSGGYAIYTKDCAFPESKIAVTIDMALKPNETYTLAFADLK